MVRFALDWYNLRMIPYLHPQPANNPPKIAYIIIEPYKPNPIVACVEDPKSKCRQERPNPDDLGGHFVTISGGTAASNVSGSLVRSYEFTEFVPTEGHIPRLLVQMDYEGKMLEIKPEYRIKLV